MQLLDWWGTNRFTVADGSLCHTIICHTIRENEVWCMLSSAMPIRRGCAVKKSVGITVSTSMYRFVACNLSVDIFGTRQLLLASA